MGGVTVFLHSPDTPATRMSDPRQTGWVTKFIRVALQNVLQRDGMDSHAGQTWHVHHVAELHAVPRRDLLIPLHWVVLSLGFEARHAEC